MYEKIKKWYQQGLWTQEMVANAVIKGIITQEQYEAIINDTPIDPSPTAKELLNIIVGEENI